MKIADQIRQLKIYITLKNGLKIIIDCFIMEDYLLYIDGEHTYNAVKMDLELWHPKMKHKSTIWGDDWNILGVRQAVNEFCDAQKITISS